MKTFFDLLNHIKKDYIKQNFLSLTIDGVTTKMPYEIFLNSIDQIASFLNLCGFKKDDKAIIMLDSSPTWLVCDLGITKAGLVCAPMFSNISFDNMLYQFENCEAKMIFIQDEATFNLVKKTGYLFDLIVTLKPLSKEALEGAKNTKIYSIEEALNEGLQNLQITKPNLLQIEKDVKEDDTVTIIYTSGTSGKPKGVELSHKNIISQITSIDIDYKEVLKKEEDVIFSFLPLAHIFQRTVTYYFLSKCVICHFSNDIKSVADNLEKFQPSAVAVVPRFLEKVKNGLAERIKNEKSFLKKIIASICFKYAQNHEPTNPHSIFYSFFDKVMYSKVRNKLGGKLKIMLTGGAGVPNEVYRFFINLGVPLYQGYGLTETSPVVSVGTPKANKIYTIGKPIRGVEVKLAEDKELLVKGPNVMKGYYKMDNSGARVIDENGFLYTGDLAEIDSEGYIKIIGRKKEQFKTSNGKFINPVKIEGFLNAIPFIETSCVIAENRPFVTVVLFPSEDGVKNLESLELELPTKIKEVNEKLDRHESIHYFYLHDKPATIDAGQITPSMKIIRTAIEKQFKNEIEDFYSKFNV